APPPQGVVLSVSVDWEGAYFDADALAAVGRFRAENRDVPITHFVCPAYYTKPGAVAREATFLLREHMAAGDEVGVHLHVWNSLVQAARVPVRSGRSFLTEDGRLMEFEGDAGFDLDPTIYTASELRAILKTSRRLLDAAGFEVAPVFRAGGWLAGPGVLEAARAEGFTIDSSAVDAGWLGEGASTEGFELLEGKLRALWPGVDRKTQPFLIATPAGEIIEIPDSGAMADHVASEEMEDHVAWAAGVARRPVFVHLGFHAETAHHYADLLSRALDNLRRRKVPIAFVTVSRAAAIARPSLGRK
ncbi:MAG TPA: hypothetical protein VFU21_21045, partial [Kofleriaceae bacterium]|nr:hypothetical protein [Kofleriaceae bacterium]